MLTVSQFYSLPVSRLRATVFGSFRRSTVIVPLNAQYAQWEEVSDSSLGTLFHFLFVVVNKMNSTTVIYETHSFKTGLFVAVHLFLQ